MFLQSFKASDWLLPTVLSTTAGAVDVIGFLALGVVPSLAQFMGLAIVLIGFQFTLRR